MFHYFWVQTIFMLRRVKSRFSVENFLSHSAETFRRGTFLCCDPENFWFRRNLRRREGGYQDFPSKNFCLTLPKKFVGEPFCAVFQKISGIPEIYGEEGVGYQDFTAKSFCLTLPKKYIGEPFSVPLFLGIDKFYASEGCVTIFCRKFLVSRCQNFL